MEDQKLIDWVFNLITLTIYNDQEGVGKLIWAS